jgi:hypothetical protein
MLPEAVNAGELEEAAPFGPGANTDAAEPRGSAPGFAESCRFDPVPKSPLPTRWSALGVTVLPHPVLAKARAAAINESRAGRIFDPS